MHVFSFCTVYSITLRHRTRYTSLIFSFSGCSTAEEKGSDCIDKFKGMQECFQRFPELYKDYDEDSEETAEEEKGERVAAVKEEEGERHGSSESSTDDYVIDAGSRQLTSSSVPAS